MSLSSIVREYMKKMLAEAGKGMKVLLVDSDTVGVTSGLCFCNQFAFSLHENGWFC